MNDSTTATLRALTSDVERLLADKLRPVGITVSQMEFLAIFAGNPGFCGAEAAEAAHVRPQTVTTVMQNLAAKRLITVKQVRGEGRRNTVTVTKAGAKVLAQAQGAVADVEERLYALLGLEARFRIADSINALKPYLPQRTWQPRPWPGHAKPPQTKSNAADAEAVSGGAMRLNQRCRGWARSMSTGASVPGYVALQLGTQVQIDQLVAAGLWKPDGNGYRISD